MREETKEELKKLLVSDENVTRNFLIALLYGVYKDEDPKEYETFLLDNYEAYDYLISQNEDIKKSLSEVFNDMISDTMINDTINTYTDLADNEAKQLIYSVSRLLFIQDKYKDDEIGQEIDSRIKEWLDYIRYYDEKEINEILDPHNKKVGSEDYTLALNKMSAKIFHQTIPSLNYDIYNTREPKRAFMSLWNDHATSNDLKGFINNFINNKIEDGKTRERYINKFHNLINDTIERKQISNFENTYAKEIQELRNTPKKDIIQDKQSIDLKNSILMRELSDERKGQSKVLDELVHDTFINSVYELYNEYQKTKEYKDLEQTQEDVKIWRDKADNFIKHLINYDGIALIGLFTMDYMLDHLAYSDYQKEAYKLDLEDDIKVIKEGKNSDKRVTKTAQKSSNTTPKKTKRDYKALREKYKDVTRLTEPLDYNRKWAKLDNSKENTNIMSIREQIQNYKRSDEDKINKEIYDLQNLNTLTKEQKEKLEELIEDKKELLEEKKEQQQKLDNIKDEIRLLNETLEQASDITETRRLKRFLKQKETKKESLEKALSNNGVAFQQNLLTGNLEYKQENKRKHESTTIVIPQDYDISQFNQESRNFLYYIPNIPNIMDELEKDFITIDISDYLSFTGRETGNVSRIRKKLFNSLKEMKKESYEFSYRGSKGELIEGSLSIIGDIITTEYKGKATVSVHLEPTYKNNIRRAFNTNQIANINKEVFKLGQGSTNKIEKITKEIAIYLTRLARNDAKNGLKNGKWVKDIHIKTLIDYLVSINLIDYDTRYYSRYVKEPLQDALNLGKDLNLFDYKTNAFEYYDNSISKSMNWTRDKEHIAEFESGKDNGVHIILNADNIADLEKNQKANTTYKKYQKKYDKKTTK